MKNPAITVTQEALVVVHKHTRSLALHIGKEDTPLKNLICSFQENDECLNASVIAHHHDHQQLARRVVSFLGAYMRVTDIGIMERDIQRSIESCLYQQG